MARRFLKPIEVAEILNISIRTLEGWRSTGDGPVYTKPTSRVVRYDPAAIEDFVARGARRSTSDEVGKVRA